MIYETRMRFIKTFTDLIHFIRALNLGKHFFKDLMQRVFHLGRLSHLFKSCNIWTHGADTSLPIAEQH